MTHQIPIKGIYTEGQHQRTVYIYNSKGGSYLNTQDVKKHKYISSNRSYNSKFCLRFYMFYSSSKYHDFAMNSADFPVFAFKN